MNNAAVFSQSSGSKWLDAVSYRKKSGSYFFLGHSFFWKK